MAKWVGQRKEPTVIGINDATFARLDRGELDCGELEGREAGVGTY